MKTAFIAVVALGLVGASAARSQTADGPRGEAGPIFANPEAAPRPVTRATRATGKITVDGVLDEPSWFQAPALSDFIQSQPRPGYPASERTVVRVLYDSDYIYVGAICYDSEPDRIISVGLDQDFSTHDSDVFGVALDTYGDRQNAFVFITNPAGALFDAQTFDNSRVINRAWEGVVYVKTAVHDSGWTAEFAIPLTTLRFRGSAGEQAWGINFLRRIRRRNEESYWAPMHRYNRLHTMSLAGTITGLEGLRQSRNLSVKPYVLGGNVRGSERPEGQTGTQLDAGVDLKYGITSRLTLDLTYRTDFSQVEVDEEQVNLTRFSLFFPEKRDFFMENAGTFAFGDINIQNYRLGTSPRDFTLFHSRRIGLLGGRPVPIVGGGRLTGRAGAFDIGILDLQSEALDSLPAENFGVVRLKANVLGSSQIGAIFTSRQATTAGLDTLYNRSYGADFTLRMWDHLLVHSYIAATEGSNLSGDNRAANLLLAWRDRFWDLSGLVKRVGDDFEPGVGFVRRNGMRQAYATVGAHPRPGVLSLQEINPYVEGNFITDLQGELETRELTAALDAEFLSGGLLNFSYTDRYERLVAPFRVSSEAIVAPGIYQFGEFSAGFRSPGGSRFGGGLRLNAGGFYDGTRTTLGLNAFWRPNHHFSMDASAERNRVRLSTGEFTADVYRWRAIYAYSTKLFASALVQYNTSSDEVSVNARINFIHAPLSDVFLVFTERRNLARDELLDRAVTLKITRLLAF
ncbi:MAG: hypothetical protein KatS3mg081_2282 [Gemmatimonadales bacterium]|nr:MAG: hypothetical protein KatS3mg081_2282 [Gemmatimonadales bacterium]